MSIEGENRELLFQELYNMVGYHLAKYEQMPSIEFKGDNPKSSDPTKHVEYDENERKIIIHTGRFKMKREDILEKLRGFKCEIGVDGQTESVEFDFTTTSQGNNSIAVGALEGFLTLGERQQVSEERKEKYYAKKKTPIVNRNQEDGNERLEEVFNNVPNRGPEGNSNSVQNIVNRYGNNGGPQQPGQQPSGGQQTKPEMWLTDTITCYPSVQEVGIDKLLGVNLTDGSDYTPNIVAPAVKDKSSNWEKEDFKPVSLRQAAQQGNFGARRVNTGHNFNNNFNNPMMNQNQNMMNPNMMRNGIQNQYQNMLNNNNMINNQLQPNNYFQNNNYNNNNRNMLNNPNFNPQGNMYNQFPGYQQVQPQNINAGYNAGMVQGQNQMQPGGYNYAGGNY